MKRFLLSSLTAVAMLGVCTSSNAQTVVATDFESTTGVGLPTGWSQSSTSTPGWITTNMGTDLYFATVTGVPRGSRYAVVADYNGSSSSADNSNDILETPVFSLSGVTNPYLTFDFFFFGAYTTGTPSDSEKLSIVISTDGGTTWSTLQSLAYSAGNTWESKQIDLSSYSGTPNMKVGVKYSDGGGNLIGAAVDNIKVYGRKTNDVSVNSIDMQNIAANGSSVKFTFTNFGTATVTDLTAEYAINSGTPVSQTFTGLNIAPFASAQLTFSTTIAGLTGTGTATIDVTATQVNSAPDDNPTDNTKSWSFNIASTSVLRNGLIEEFSSSTCVPCAGFNAIWDPLAQSYNIDVAATHVNVIKYQMNWPSPNNDSSYNGDGLDRRNYYGVNAIPDHFANGVSSDINAGSSTADMTAEMDATKADPAFWDITGTYTVNANSDSLMVNVTVTPHITISGNYSVHIAAVERHYVNPYATTTQSDYYHVMRMMFPNGNGMPVTSWTDGSAKNYTYARAYTIGHPEQMNDHFWGDPYSSDLVVFVQDNNSHAIMQSIVIPAQWPTAVGNVTKEVTGVSIYPNPAKDNATVEINMNTAGNVKLFIIDAAGRTVNTIEQNLGAGVQKVNINTSALAAGTYNVMVQSASGAVPARLSVVK